MEWDAAVVRALASQQCDLLFRCYMWVEFVVVSHLALKVFLQVLRFSSLHKNQHSKFQFDQDRRPTRKPATADSALYLILVLPN